MSEKISEKQTSYFIRSGILTFFLLLALASYLTTPLGSSEFYAHLWRGGMIEHVKTSYLENSIYALFAVPIFAPRVFDFFISQTEVSFGLIGLIFLKLTLVFIFISSFYLTLRKISASRFFAIFLTFILGSFLLESPSLSVNLLSLSIFTLYCAFLFIYRPKPGLRRSLKKLILALFPIIFLFHAFVVFIPYEVARGFSLQRFLDYKLAGLCLIFFVLLVIKFQQKTRTFRSTFFLVLLFLLVLFVTDLAPYYLIYLACMSAREWKKAEGQFFSKLLEGLISLRNRLLKLPIDGVLWLALVFCILNIRSLYFSPENNSLFPVRAMDYVVDNQLEGKILSVPLIGSYINYRLSYQPGSEQNSKTFAIFFDDYRYIDPVYTAWASKLFRDASGLLQIEERFQAETAICLNGDALCRVLSKSKRWLRVYPEGEDMVGGYYWHVYKK